MLFAHVIALDPTEAQVTALFKAAGCARFAYNWGLAEWNKQYKAGLKPSAYGLKKQFNAIKEEQFPWIYDSPKDANQQAFTNLGTSFKNFFDSIKGKRKGCKVGYPKFKKNGQNDKFYVSNDQLWVRGKIVNLPVIGPIKTFEELRFEGKILSGKVSRVADRWFISVSVEVADSYDVKFKSTSRPIVGIDLGVKTAVVTSSWQEFQSPKPLKAALKKLARANRVLHRRKKGSSNRRKAAMKVARVHARIANIRKDWAHKVTTQICCENQAVVIEDLNVSGMLRNHKLARSISDIGFGMFRRFMEYKSMKFGIAIIVASRWFPSTKTCSSCSFVNEPVPLSQRTFVCDYCRSTMDRDLNAAKSLEKYPWLMGNHTPVDTKTYTFEDHVFEASFVGEAGTNK